MKAFSREVKLIGGSLLAAAVLIVLTALVTPPPVVRDQVPTSFNTGEKGIKGAFLALHRLGYQTARWEKPSAALADVDAARTTLVITAPRYNLIANETQGVKDFVRRGGWVLAAGSGAAAMLLSDPKAMQIDNHVCEAVPEGFSSLATVQHLHFEHTFQWKSIPTELELAQSCGDRAAAVLIPMGKGTVVLWSESAPMTNEGLKHDENLALLLASLPAAHSTVLFDEYLHGERDDLWSRTRGTPVLALKLQLGLLAAAILFSFSRRHGALRELHALPRTSPLEFAHSMGSVYHRGGAGEAAVTEAQRRFSDFLARQCGLSREMLDAGPAAMVEALRQRLNYTNPRLEALLEPPAGRIKPGPALARVQALDRARAEIARIVHKLHPTAENDARV